MLPKNWHPDFDPRLIDMHGRKVKLLNLSTHIDYCFRKDSDHDNDAIYGLVAAIVKAARNIGLIYN